MLFLLYFSSLYKGEIKNAVNQKSKVAERERESGRVAGRGWKEPAEIIHSFSLSRAHTYIAIGKAAELLQWHAIWRWTIHGRHTTHTLALSETQKESDGCWLSRAQCYIFPINEGAAAASITKRRRSVQSSDSNYVLFVTNIRARARVNKITPRARNSSLMCRNEIWRAGGTKTMARSLFDTKLREKMEDYIICHGYEMTQIFGAGIETRNLFRIPN